MTDMDPEWEAQGPVYIMGVDLASGPDRSVVDSFQSWKMCMPPRWREKHGTGDIIMAEEVGGVKKSIDLRNGDVSIEFEELVERYGPKEPKPRENNFGKMGERELDI